MCDGPADAALGFDEMDRNEPFRFKDMTYIGRDSSIGCRAVIGSSKFKLAAERERYLNRMVRMKVCGVGGCTRSRKNIHNPQAASFPNQNTAAPRDLHEGRLSEFRRGECSN